jgi:hypothetical protein
MCTRKLHAASRRARLRRQREQSDGNVYRDLYCSHCDEWTEHVANDDGPLAYACEQCGEDAKCDSCGAIWHDDHGCD